MTTFAPVTLTGQRVRLEPLQPEHHDELVEAVRDGDLWELWFTKVPAPEEMRGNIAWRLERASAGWMVPFTVRRMADGSPREALGMTSMCNVDPANRRTELGYTWLRRSVQGTGVNAELKLLLLQHCFETLGLNAVELRTHHLNHRSRAAMERLGARLDGVLRSHQVMPDGSLRDTCVYSILAHEWPAVRTDLRFRLGHSAQA